MEVYSIGFTRRTAERFFGTLKGAGVRRLVDVRLNNSSQLAGFSKRDDLEFFLSELCGAEYVHEPLLAPTQELLDGYRKDKGGWDPYAAAFLELLEERAVERTLERSLFDVPTVLLCSEPTADFCHRRLVLEYLERRWGDLTIRHL
jgi:uncharacterized protein (DUF488 family)